MQLDEFISETLKAIIKGVKDAQEFAKTNDAFINPCKSDSYYPAKHIEVEAGKATVLSIIDFDVAVSASNKQESGVSGGINVLSINLGGKTTDTDYNQTVSRIKFNIEALLPSTVPSNYK